MYYAIETRYLGPTERRGARIAVRFAATRRIYPYPHEERAGENAHAWAAQQLIADLHAPWRVLGGGALHDETGYVYVVETLDR